MYIFKEEVKKYPPNNIHMTLVYQDNDVKRTFIKKDCCLFTANENHWQELLNEVLITIDTIHKHIDNKTIEYEPNFVKSKDNKYYYKLSKIPYIKIPLYKNKSNQFVHISVHYILRFDREGTEKTVEYRTCKQFLI